MDQLGIEEDDLVEKFVLGTGSGGQKVNKTHSCVFLRHEPSGIQVKCQEGRSRAANRFHARALLCDRFEQGQEEEERRRKSAAAKRRRRNRRRSASSKAHMLAEKRHRSRVKELRKSPDETEE